MCGRESNRHLRALAGLGLACWALAALAAPSVWGEEGAAGGAVAGDEQALRQRVAAYWDARVSRTAEVFDFYAPPDKGGPQKARDVSEGGNILFRTYEIEDIKIEGDSALIHLRVSTDLHLTRPSGNAQVQRDAQIRETWVKVETTWYKRPVPRGLSRHMRRRPVPDTASAVKDPTPREDGAKP